MRLKPLHWWLVFGLVLALLPYTLSESFSIALLNQASIAVLICLSYFLLLGLSGLLSFGHALYTGVGAYAAVYCVPVLQQMWPGLLVAAPLLAGFLTLLVAAVTGWLSTRRGGLVFAMITLGLGELAWTLAQRFPAGFGGEAGLSINRADLPLWGGVSLGPAENLYVLIAIYTWLCAGLMYVFTQTKFALLLRASREQAQRCAALGFDIRHLRFKAVLVSAFFAGVAGGLSALHFELVTHEVFSVARSGSYLLFTLVGGTASFLGPILGGLLMVVFTEGLPRLTGAWQAYLGLLFVWTVMRLPDGIGAHLARPAAWAGNLRLAGIDGRAFVRFVGLALVLLALVGAIEMAYQYQLRAVLGSERAIGGVVLDSEQAWHWLGVVGLGLWGAWMRYLARGSRAS